GNVPHIDKIKARIKISGHFPVKKIDNDSAGRRRFVVPRTYRRAWVDEHQRQSLIEKFLSLPLSQELRSLIVPDHVIETDRSVLIGWSSIRKKPERSYAACIHHPPDSGRQRGLHDVERTGYIALVNVARVPGP